METLADVAAYLRAEPLKYIVHLKMLAAYPQQLVWYAEQCGGQSGVALLIPAAIFPYDAKAYPGSDWVVLLAASVPEVAQRLVQRLPRQSKLVFKLVDELSKAAVFEIFPARRVTAFVSFTSRGCVFLPDADVVVSRELDPRLLPCYQSNGYSETEMKHYFQQGALSFSLYADEALATCFVFRNYEQIWEIGGVYTAPEQRRKGLAKRVVSTALSALLEQGKTPRYQVAETNLASLRLAENLGLERFVITEHYLFSAV